MPLFKSLRSRSSRKSTASETSDINTDFGPRSPSSTTHGSVRSTKNGNAATTQSTSMSSMDSKMTASNPSSPTRYRPMSSYRDDGVNNGGGPTLMQTVSETKPSNFTSEPEIAKPRPSELFAGKGVQWDSVKLAGPPPSPSTMPRSNTNEELQQFLKMRRQWKPTFATEGNGSPERKFQPPKDLSQLTFSSDDNTQPQGLMSFKDLDESHQRKQKLMNSPPRGGGLFDEAESSKAAATQNRQVVERGSSLPKKSRPESTRKASNKSARKIFGGGAKGSEADGERHVPIRSLSNTEVKGVKEEEAVGAKATTAFEQARSSIKETSSAPPSQAVPPIPTSKSDHVEENAEGDSTIIGDEKGSVVNASARGQSQTPEANEPVVAPTIPIEIANGGDFKSSAAPTAAKPSIPT